MHDAVTVALISAVASIAVGYMPVIKSLIKPKDSVGSEEDEVAKLKKENVELKKEIENDHKTESK